LVEVSMQRVVLSCLERDVFRGVAYHASRVLDDDASAWIAHHERFADEAA